MVFLVYESDVGGNFWSTVDDSENVCMKTLELLGGKDFIKGMWSSLAMVGYKGTNTAYFVQQVMNSAGQGPSDLNGSVWLQWF